MTNEATNETKEVPTVTAHGADVAPEKAGSKNASSRKKGAPKGKKMAKGAKSQKAAKTAKGPGRKAATSKGETKGGKILEMIGRAKGATLAEIMTATGWQAHSVRGFISTAGKKHNVGIESAKNEAGGRLYRTTK